MMRLALSKGDLLSQEDVNGENDEAAHSKCRVDADHFSAIRILKIRVASNATTNQCCQRNQCGGNDTEGGTPWSSSRGGPPSARTRQLRPPTARSPCRAASDHGGVAGSVWKSRTASTEPNETATPRMTKAAINMTRHSTACTRASFRDVCFWG